VSWRYLTVLLALAALAVGAAACGGDDDEPITTAPEISVPAGEPQTVPQQQTTTNQQQPTTTTAPQGSGGTQAPSQNYNPGKPDSPKNDVPPEPGTPESKFEQYCQQNPGACG
jgi:hypothetical protein